MNRLTHFIKRRIYRPLSGLITAVYLIGSITHPWVTIKTASDIDILILTDSGINKNKILDYLHSKKQFTFRGLRLDFHVWELTEYARWFSLSNQHDTARLHSYLTAISVFFGNEKLIGSIKLTDFHKLDLATNYADFITLWAKAIIKLYNEKNFTTKQWAHLYLAYIVLRDMTIKNQLTAADIAVLQKLHDKNMSIKELVDLYNEMSTFYEKYLLTIGKNYE